jgi:hypothetical protein
MARFENNLLLPLKPKKHNQKFATFDIEATDWINFLMAGIYDGEEYIFCPDLESLVNGILKRKYSGYIFYSHYGGGYDLRFILDFVMKNLRDQYDIDIIETHGLIIALDIYTKNYKHHWRFYDSFQIMKGGLDKLTKVFGVQHQKLSETVDRKNLSDTPETREYLKHDCIGLYEVLEKFYKIPLVEGTGHKVTTSSLAMAVFRSKYLKDTRLYKLSPDKEEFVRSGYYGGRNEIFKMTGKNVNEYDVNSMYVSAMLKPLPCGTGGWWTEGYDLEDTDMGAFIYATVKCPDSLHIPLLPAKYKGKLLFPSGEFTGVFYSAELAQARKLGYNIQIHQALVFPVHPFLAEYAGDCWRIRQDNPGDNPLNITAKLLGNGLYGKFAQKRERDSLVFEPDFEAAAAQGWTPVMPEYDLWRKPTYSESSQILPYISAAITSYSRLNLHEYLNIYPEKVCYCDTDSVFIEDEELPTGKGLGELKHENHHNRFIAIQPKFYLCEKSDGSVKCRAKGFTFDKNENDKDIIPWNYDDFRQALETGDYQKFAKKGEYKLSKLREAMRNNDFLMLVARSRSVQTPYSKRFVMEDLTTKPISMDYLQQQQKILEQEMEQRDQERQYKKYKKDYRMSFKRAVIQLGGIRPHPDYPDLPRWCKRLRGQGLDVIRTELESLGWYTNDTNEFYEKLKENV